MPHIRCLRSRTRPASELATINGHRGAAADSEDPARRGFPRWRTGIFPSGPCRRSPTRRGGHLVRQTGARSCSKARFEAAGLPSRCNSPIRRRTHREPGQLPPAAVRAARPSPPAGHKLGPNLGTQLGDRVHTALTPLFLLMRLDFFPPALRSIRISERESISNRIVARTHGSAFLSRALISSLAAALAAARASATAAS